MKFTINKTDMIDVLSKIKRLSADLTKNGVLIKTSGDNILISVDNFKETRFEVSCHASIEKPGLIVLNFKKFHEIIRKFPNDEILIDEIENRQVEIGNEKIQYRIFGMDPDNFLNAPHVEDVLLFDIDSKTFKKMIDTSVSIKAPKGDSHAHINGVYFEKINRDKTQLIRMVSTDRKRLYVSDIEYSRDTELPDLDNVLIPKEGLRKVSKSLKVSKSIKVQVGVKYGYFIVTNNKETIIIRLFDGSFPEYKYILTKGKGCVLLKKKQFVEMLERISILTSGDFKGAVFSFKGKELVVKLTNPEIGEVEESMSINFGWKDIEVIFNPKFFIDALRFIEEKNIVLNITDERNPCLVQGENNSNYISAIIPMI